MYIQHGKGRRISIGLKQAVDSGEKAKVVWNCPMENFAEFVSLITFDFLQERVGKMGGKRDLITAYVDGDEFWLRSTTSSRGRIDQSFKILNVDGSRDNWGSVQRCSSENATLDRNYKYRYEVAYTTPYIGVEPRASGLWQIEALLFYTWAERLQLISQFCFDCGRDLMMHSALACLRKQTDVVQHDTTKLYHMRYLFSISTS